MEGTRCILRETGGRHSTSPCQAASLMPSWKQCASVNEALVVVTKIRNVHPPLFNPITAFTDKAPRVVIRPRQVAFVMLSKVQKGDRMIIGNPSWNNKWIIAR